jgi:hypothetical protein
MTMGFKPEAVAFWMDGAPIADDDPLAAVKHRAHAISQAAEVLDEAARAGYVTAEADRLDEAAGLFADPAFDPGETWDQGAAAGLTEAELSAASYVAYVLRLIELDGSADDDPGVP